MKSTRIIAALVATALLALFGAGRAVAATVTVKATVKTVKPLTLTSKQDLDFGQVILTSVSGPTSVSLSQTGVLTCGVGLTCAGAVRPAIYNITGSNNQIVRIFSLPSTLTNGSGGSIAFTPNAPASVTLTSSGIPGNDFNVGGSIAITPATVEGLYSGNVEITVDYQ